MLQLAARGVVVVVALGMHDAQVGREAAPARLVEAGQPLPRIAQAVVQLAAQVVVHQPHAGRPVAAVARGLAQMLAEQQGVVARDLGVEVAVPVVAPVAEPARDVVLPLRVAAVAIRAGVAVVGPEEIVRHMLHRVQAQAVQLGRLHDPARAPVQVGPHVFLKEVRIGRDHAGGQAVALAEADVEVGVGVARPVVGVPQGGRHIGVRHAVVELGEGGMPDEARLGAPRSLGQAVVLVGRLVREVDQVGQAQVHDLPGVGPVARVVPLAVEAVLRPPQVEILRHQAGINIHRRVLVVGGNVEGAVVHDVVRVHAEAEPVRRLHHVQQLGLRAVARGHRAALAAPAQIEGIEKVVADRQPAAALGRGWNPQRGVAGLGQLRHLVRQVAPAGVEDLQHDLGRGRAHRPQQPQQQTHTQATAHNRSHHERTLKSIHHQAPAHTAPGDTPLAATMETKPGLASC